MSTPITLPPEKAEVSNTPIDTSTQVTPEEVAPVLAIHDEEEFHEKIEAAREQSAPHIE